MAYLKDGRIGQSFRNPRTGKFVVVFDIKEDGTASFCFTNCERRVGPVAEIFPMGDWEPVEIPEIAHTPWGPPQHVGVVAEGVYRIVTASHGGLMLSDEAQAALPAGVPQMLLNGPEWAEEDCEEIIVLALLGHVPLAEVKWALELARKIPRYQPAVAKLCELAGVEAVEIPTLNPLQGSYAHADGRTEYDD